MSSQQNPAQVQAPWITQTRIGHDVVMIVGNFLLLIDGVSDSQRDQIMQLIREGKIGDAAAVKGSGALVPIKDIIELCIREHRSQIDIRWSSGNKHPSRELNILSYKGRLAFANQVRTIMGPQAIEATRNEALWKRLLKPVTALIFVLALGYASFKAAYEPNLENREVSGARAGIKKLYLEALIFLGPTGVLIATLLGIAICIGLIVMKLKNPQQETVIHKPAT